MMAFISTKTDSDNTTAYVSMEAVVNGEKHVSSNVMVLEGDDLIFSCFGNKMGTENDLKWMLNENPLEEDLKRDWGLTVKSEFLVLNIDRYFYDISSLIQCSKSSLGS